MIRIAQAPWFAAMLGTVAFLATMTALMKLPPVKIAAHGAAKILLSPNNDPSWKFRNPEFDQWMLELKEERQGLAARAQQLKELQVHLDAERTELSAATQMVAQLQAEFDRSVVRFNDQQDENVRREVKLFSAMPLETTVKLIGSMTDEEVVRLLIMMKTEQASLILDAINKAGKEGSKRTINLMDLMRRSVPETGETKKSAVQNPKPKVVRLQTSDFRIQT